MKHAVLYFCAFLIALSGCSVNKATINTYTDPTFTKGQVSKVAVFPIRNARFAPSEAQQINRKISMAINQRNPSVSIMSSSEATQLLNENNLTEDWAKFLDNYISSGVPNANTLNHIGKVLGVDAIMQGEIVNIYQADGNCMAGTRAMTRVTVRFSMMGTQNGKMLWESTSDGIKGTATVVESAPPIIEVVNMALDKILITIPF